VRGSVEVGGARIAYRVDGPAAGPVLVLANSLGTTLDMWAPQMTAFASRFRVVRYDHRGHGGSTDTPGPYDIDLLGGDLLAVLDEIGAGTSSICGLSLGGMVAVWVAAHAPQRVDRLALCCTAPRLGPPEQWYERAATVRRQGTRHLLDGLMQRWFTPGFPDRHPEVRAAVTGMLAAATPGGYAACCEAIASLDLTGVLGSLAAPTLVLAGADDPVVPAATALELALPIPRASLVVLPDAAHLANLEQPARFTTAVVEHLVGPAAERGDQTRRQVLGDDHVDAAAAARTPFTADFQDFITRYAWGEIWTRPGLDRRTRSCITLAMLVGAGRFDELPLHVRGAVRNGLSPADIGEVLLQTAVYCGVPAANTAFAVARRTLDEMHGG
jgi:3-oxoadipate enol-lactonase/4-carboxymuconolactone decarboxylase